MAYQPRGPQRLSSRHKPVSGTMMMSMLLVLERFVVALAATEAPTRQDPKKFITDLRAEAIEAGDRFSHPEGKAEAEMYVDDLIQQIAAEAGIELTDG